MSGKSDVNRRVLAIEAKKKRHKPGKKKGKSKINMNEVMEAIIDAIEDPDKPYTSEEEHEDALDKLKTIRGKNIVKCCKVPDDEKTPGAPGAGPSSSTEAELRNVLKCRICNRDHWTSTCPWKDTIFAGGKVPDEKKTPGAPGASPSSSSTEAELKNVVKCRICNGDHWTSKCTQKDTILAGGKVQTPGAPIAGLSSSNEAGKTGIKYKYIPPGMREGAKRGKGPNLKRREAKTAIRIANLSESTTEGDLEELVKRLGPIQKLYLAKDKSTGLCKGFAYIHFKFKNDAAYAITKLDGHGYDHLILSADWSKPLDSANN